MSIGPADLSRLLSKIDDETDIDLSLSALINAALVWTRSRNAMIGRMNDDLGALELTHGAGLDWEGDTTMQRVNISDREGAGIVAYVAARGASFVTGNVMSDPHYMNLFPSSRSEVAVPVRDRYERIRAVLNVESDQENHYRADDLATCECIAKLIGIVISREEQQRREDALVQIGSTLDQAVTEADLIDNILDVAEEVLRFQNFSIFLYDSTQDMFVLRGSIGPLKDKVGSVGYASGEGCTGWVCANAVPLRLEHPQNDPRWKGRWLEFHSETIASYLAVPVVYRGKSLGALRVVRRVSENPYQEQRFTEEDERLLSSVAEQLAVGLENLRQMQKAINIERMAAWGELSAKSSHMIGNRVFALRGDVNELGYMISDGDTSPEKLQEIQKSLVTNVTRVDEILQEFRDFVVATQLSTVRADLNSVIREAVSEVFPRRSKFVLQYDLSDKLPEVMIDHRKMRRAITEIVENSLSFFEEGQLSVSSYLADADLVKRARLPKSRRYLVIEIEDQGPGVDAERKELIFQPFYSSRVKGMGLGLSIVKGIVESHGGTVMELGQPGMGAKFVILLPAATRTDKQTNS